MFQKRYFNIIVDSVIFDRGKMFDFRCINCGSDNIQIVRGIYKFGTEIENSKIIFFKSSHNFSPIRDKHQKLDVNILLDLMANQDHRIQIKSQSILSKKLGNFKLAYYTKSEAENSFFSNISGNLRILSNSLKSLINNLKLIKKNYKNI